MTVKHPTASVFLFSFTGGAWRLGLIHHRVFGKHMPPGGHVEPHENPAQTAIREVKEETGIDATLLTPPGPTPPLGVTVVGMPWWIVEEHIPADRWPHPHIHIDHLYVATAHAEAAGPAELPFAWHAARDLDDLDTFDGTRRLAHALFTGMPSPSDL